MIKHVTVIILMTVKKEYFTHQDICKGVHEDENNVCLCWTIYSSFPLVLWYLALMWATVIARFHHVYSIWSDYCLAQGKLHFMWFCLCVLWRKVDLNETVSGVIIFFLTSSSETTQDRKNSSKFWGFLSSVNCILSRAFSTERIFQPTTKSFWKDRMEREQKIH